MTELKEITIDITKKTTNSSLVVVGYTVLTVLTVDVVGNEITITTPAGVVYLNAEYVNYSAGKITICF